MKRASVFAIALATMVRCAAPAVVMAQHAPVIEHLEPTSGPPGTKLQIVGRGFVAGTRVMVGETELSIEDITPSRVVARLPQDSPSGVVTVITQAGDARGPEFRVTQALPPPTITTFTPLSGPPGTEVVLRGEGFGVGLWRTQVSLNGRPLVVRSAGATTLRVIVPDDAHTGLFEVSVRDAGSAQSAVAFDVLARTEIKNIEPRGVAAGAVVTLSGTGFSVEASRNRVYLNNLRCTVEAASDTTLKVRVPQRAVTGRLLVDVRGGGRAESASDLVVQRMPTLVSATPSKALATSLITLSGTNFGSDASAIELRLGDLVLPVRDVTDQSMVVELPASAQSGALQLRVHGVGPALLSGGFEVLAPLSLRAFEPGSGPVGTVVTIAGTGFSPVASANLVTMSDRVLDVLGATPEQLRVRVTPGGSGSLQVKVQGSGVARLADPFVVTTPPVINSFAPAQATIGNEVTIVGSRFGSDPLAVKVTLGSVVQEIVSVRDDAIRVRIAPGSQTAPLSVRTALQGSALSQQPFVVLPALVVLQVVPERVATGATVEVRGSGFQPGAVVVWGEQIVEPDAITETRMRFRVPVNALGGLLTVRLRDGRDATAPRPVSIAP